MAYYAFWKRCFEICPKLPKIALGGYFRIFLDQSLPFKIRKMLGIRNIHVRHVRKYPYFLVIEKQQIKLVSKWAFSAFLLPWNKANDQCVVIQEIFIPSNQGYSNHKNDYTQYET